MIDLSCKIGGVELKSPVISSSAVDGKDGLRIKEVAGQGIGAATTKTIVKEMQLDVLPNMKRVSAGSMINCVFGANLTAEQWFNNEFPAAIEAGIPIIANMAGTTPEEAIELAIQCEKAGASIIEYPSACPHMANVLEAMYPGLKVALPEVADPTEFARQVAAIKKAVKIPVIAKLSGIFQLHAKEWAIAVVEAGADAVAASDSIGPAIDIDIRTGQPVLGGPRGYGGLTGAALKPLTLRMVLEISEAVDVPVIGIGGVATAEDAIQYIMAGATAVELATASTMKGVSVYGTIIKGIEKFMAERGYTKLDDFRGLTHRCIEDRKARHYDIIQKVELPVLDETKCIGCGQCEKSCAYHAMKVANKRPAVDVNLCEGCGMCVSVCPVGALSQPYFNR